MVRNLLGVIVALALPSLLAGQAPGSPNPATAKATLAHPHGIATQVQGEVVPAEELDGPHNQEGVNDAHGENNDGEVNQQEDVNEPDDLNNDVNVGEQVDQAGEHQDDNGPPAPPSGTAPRDQIGRHKP